MKNNIGFLSLIAAFSGLVLFEILLQFNYLTHSSWHIVKAGFEAATIGGVADWFAVRALFYEIPIPFVRKHTNIIVKNREKLTEGIVDLVTNKWLSPEVITEKLSDVDIASAILEFLQNPKSQKKTVGFIREIALKLTAEIDRPEFVAAINKRTSLQLNQVNLASPIGNWLENAVRTGEHHAIWELVIEAAETSLHNEDSRDLILSKLEEAVKEYSDQGFLKKTTMFFAKKSGGLDINSITAELLFKTHEMLLEAKFNPDHVLRLKFDNWLTEFAQKLAAGDEDAAEFIIALKSKFTTYLETEKTIEKLLQHWKFKITEQLANDQTPLMQFLIANLNHFIAEIQQDKEAQNKVNAWITSSISELLTKFHGEIGNMVRNSLMKLDNTELVEQIEGKVGSDLQYIRLNGAVVGGLVGIAIAAVKFFIG